MLLAGRENKIEVKSQGARPKEGAERRPRCYVALDGAHRLEDVHTFRLVLLAKMSEVVPRSEKVPGGGEQVSNG